MSSHSFTSEKIKTSVITALLLAGMNLPVSASFFHLHDSNNTPGTGTGTGMGSPTATTPGTTTPIATTIPPTPNSDYLAGANERVGKAQAQLDTAKKQLAAAKALVKAAKAEYTAAQADRQALTLETTAQGMATQSGLQTGTPTGSEATTPTSSSMMPLPAPGSPTSTGDIGTQDFGGSGSTTGGPTTPSADPTNTGPATLR